MMRRLYAEDRITFDPARARGALATLLDDPRHGSILLPCEEIGPPCGYVVVSRGFSLEQGGTFALLDELYLAPHARGRGWGAQLLAAVQALARDWGVASLRLEVHHHNPRAKALYTRLGYRDDHRDILTCPLDGAPDP